MADFVKSAATRVPVDRTQGQIIQILRRYGAHGFGFRTLGDVVTVSFQIRADSSSAERNVEIPIDVEHVRERLAKLKGGTRDRGQAERVAWRIVLDWIDASLSAVSIGAQTLEEAFFAHLVIQTDDGQSGRMADYFASVAGTDPRQRLPAATRFTRAIGAGS